MITKEDLDRLNLLRQGATIGPLVVAQMDSRGQWYQLQTPKNGGGGIILGTWLRKGNAEYMAAAWEYLPKLIEVIQRGQGEEVMAYTAPDDSADRPVVSERPLYQHGEGVSGVIGASEIPAQAPETARAPRLRGQRRRQAQQARRVSGDV